MPILKSFSIKEQGPVYEIQFTMNALRELEKLSGHSIPMIGLTLMSPGRVTVGLLQEILWAGLEGARTKQRKNTTPRTIEDVGDIIDEYPGGVMEFFQEGSEPLKAIMEAWHSAFPTKEREEIPKDPPPAETANESIGTTSPIQPSSAE